MLEHHSDLLNLISHIAVQIQNLPDWDVDWTDTRPQKPRSSLTCSDFLPDDSDSAELHKRAIQHIMEVLVSEFISLSDLQTFLPPRESPHATSNSVVVPMQILFKDEKHMSETIEVLSNLLKDAALDGQPQVIEVICTCIHIHNSHSHLYVYA